MKLQLLLFTISLVFATEVDFQTSNKLFAARIYKKISKCKDGNFLISPLSIQTILALTQAGCRGKSATEIRKALNFTQDPRTIEATFKNLSFESNKYTVRTANKIYIKDDFSVKNDFKKVCRSFGAETQNIDFTGSQASQVINTWVQHQTNNTIKNLINPSDLNDRTRVLLVNALYFKANWSKPFPIAYTKKLDFHISPSKNITVDMMLLHEKHFNYYESANLKAKFLELPFEGEDASMVIVLPDEIDGLRLLETQMKKVLKPRRFTNHFMNVALPRFRIGTSVDFKKVLQKMGVGSIFDDRSADLSGVAGEKGDLVVDKVAQKSYIDVSEEGVEAAAATYVLIAIPMSAPPERPKKFRVDRPFIFYIKIKGVVVFVGRVTNPLKLN